MGRGGLTFSVFRCRNMIKKLIIRILLIFMITAFSAIVIVQWIWIKYAIRERQYKFSSRVYDVLNRVVNRVEEINYMKYLLEMQQQLGEIRNYNELISSSGGNTTWPSTYLFVFSTIMLIVLRRTVLFYRDTGMLYLNRELEK